MFLNLMALDGNEQMLRLLLDRLLPAKPKDNSIDINLPTNNIPGQQQHITKKLNQGSISPSTALTLIKYVHEQAKITELAELIDKVGALELAMKMGIQDDDFIEE